MKKFIKVSGLIVLAIMLTLGLNIKSAKAATSPDLGTAASFAVLAGTAITNVPTSAITGNLGLDPAAGSNYGAGVTASQVNGVIYSNNAAGPLGYQENAGLLTTAKNDLTTAYDGLAALDNAACTADYSGAGEVDLTTKSPLGPGVYCADSFSLTDNLTLTGSTGVWIFRSAATIITSPASSVTGGDPCNVWWRAETSATLDTTTSFIGNILALTSITMNTGATLNGRALARNAAVTMDSNTINNSMCVPSTATKKHTVTTTATTTATATATPISAVTSSPTIAPKLPNTGTNSDKTNWSWITITLIGASIITLTSAYILRRKKAA